MDSTIKTIVQKDRPTYCHPNVWRVWGPHDSQTITSTLHLQLVHRDIMTVGFYLCNLQSMR